MLLKISHKLLTKTLCMKGRIIAMQEDKKNVVDVIINGTKISMVSEENEQYLHDIADYINSKSNEISERGLTATSHLMKLIVSVNIADDFFKEKKKSKNLESQLDSYENALSKLEDENILLNDKIKELQTALHDTKRELQQYIELFNES